MRTPKDEVLKSLENVELYPCPFCMRKPTIIFTDDEGNHRDVDYLDNQWSGLMFAINHVHAEDLDCPIANNEGECINGLRYDTVEELAALWNERYI